MATTIQNIVDSINIKRRDTTQDLSDSNLLSAIQDVLDDMKNRHIFPWDVRTHHISYYDSLTRYSAPSDFFGFVEPRPDSIFGDLREVSPDSFDRRLNNAESEMYAVDWRENGISMRLKTRCDQDAKDIHLLSSYDGNGTITADTVTSDATNVRTETQYQLDGRSGIVSFDIDVSQSVNDYAQVSVSDMSAVDLSDEENAGGLIMEAVIPDITYISSILLRIGDGSGSYWESSITTQADGRAFESGKNAILFDWSTATKTGSPNSSATNYFLFRLTYSSSQGDMKNIYISWLRCSVKQIIPIDYATNAVVKTSGSSPTYSSTVNSTDEVLLFSGIYDSARDIVVYGATGICFDEVANKEDFLNKDTQYNTKLERLRARFPDRLKREIREINIYPA